MNIKSSNGTLLLTIIVMSNIATTIYPDQQVPKKKQSSHVIRNTKKQIQSNLKKEMERFFQSYEKRKQLPHPSTLGRTPGTFQWKTPYGSKSLDHLLIKYTSQDSINFAFMQILLKAGANPNIIDSSEPQYPTPLYKVADIPELVELLLNYGAAFIPQNNAGATALQSLFLESDEELWQQEMESARIFLHYGDDINSTTANGEPLLHNAILSNCPIEKIKFLLNNGANIELKNKYGETPLHLAVYRGEPPLIKILFDHGASLYALENKNRTPLELAHKTYYECKQSKHKACQRLLEYLEKKEFNLDHK